MRGYFLSPVKLRGPFADRWGLERADDPPDYGPVTVKYVSLVWYGDVALIALTVSGAAREASPVKTVQHSHGGQKAAVTRSNAGKYSLSSCHHVQCVQCAFSLTMYCLGITSISRYRDIDRQPHIVAISYDRLRLRYCADTTT